MKTGIDWTGKQTEIHVTYSAYLFVYIIFIAIGYIKLHQLTTQNNYRFICRHFFIFFLLFPSIFHMEFTCFFNNFISFWYMLLHNIVKWNFKISINKLEWSTRKKNIILHYFYVPMGWNEDKVVKPKNVDWKCFYYAINEENGKKQLKISCYCELLFRKCIDPYSIALIASLNFQYLNGRVLQIVSN